MDKLVELRFPAIPDRLCLVRVMVRRGAKLAGCSDELCEQLTLAVNEACTNIIQHAYGGAEADEIVLEIFNNKSSIRFRLMDFAAPVNLDSVKPRALDDLRPGGLGTHFIREIMDEYEIGHLADGRGNFLEMTKNIN